MARLIERATELVPMIQQQVESPLMGLFEELSLWIAAIVMMLSFARVMRENDGASRDLYYWIGRLVLCMILFGSGPLILGSLRDMGQAVVWKTPIKNAYDAQVSAFDSNYNKFLQAGFTVKSDDPNQSPFGVLIDNESPVKSIDKSLNPSSWNMPAVFLMITVTRGLLEFADLFLLLLGAFIMVALRLSAPFMIALAIDQKLAHQVSYPYLKGAAIFTLVTPAVGVIIGIFAYAAANVPLGMVDFTSPVFKLDPDTMRISGDPTMTVYPSLIGAAIMLVGALALFFSPYLSYRLASGQVLEGIATVASGWMGALTATAVEIAGVRHAASLQRQAENTQVHGSYNAAEIAARTGYDVRALQIRAGVKEKLAAIYGGAGAQAGVIAATASMNQALARAQLGLFLKTQGADTKRSTGQIDARYTESRLSIMNQAGKELKLAAGEQQAGVDRMWGELGSGIGRVVGPGGEVIGTPSTILSQGAANKTLADSRVSASLNYERGQLLNQDVLKESLTNTEVERLEAYKRAGNENLAETVAANKAFESRAKGAIYGGAGQAAGGVKEGAVLLGQANTRELDGALKAASQIRDAGMEAARLRAMSMVIGTVSRDIARRLEQSMTLRY
ncbi:MAG TPA: hypothetical protein VNO14_18545 [Blastocatellia bacterium]|nr:hypothetical protein [Blastocatellia bacterium]